MPRGRPKGSRNKTAATAKPPKAGKKRSVAKSTAKSGVTAPIMANTVKPSEVTKHISAGALKDLLNKALRSAEDKHDISMVFGTEVANAVKTKHLNRKMFNVYKGIWKMDAEGLRNWRDEFDLYWDLLGLDDKYQSAPPLFPIGEDPEQPEPNTELAEAEQMDDVADPEPEGDEPEGDDPDSEAEVEADEDEAFPAEAAE